ncbi:NAD-dependent epimerase/dehydratase family protein [Jiangella rhizosphaerae]|uniref:NAD(P)-dependent oxidoreductase n=1 Tax=Jiangella rhizosphaerae TaxID=2293569 RepID=A0A418KLF5_9ACTN|nr:NAD(P)-dependent oxidoreductase [Jiangella rhizosphaerae]RIQ18375.1 NAD(P)-dependent oxidoreductase [Jiangella rhizosphaerae]
MHVLVIGGAGMVGSNVVPHLAERHTVRVLDRRPVTAGGVESVRGDARSPDDVRAALDGVDGVVHMAAAVPRADGYDPVANGLAFEVNVGSPHLAMSLAAAAGVRSFVHISTMSVFEAYSTRPVDPATAVPDAVAPYGLTKRLGEQVVAALSPSLGLPACSLRLIYPTPDADWPQWRSPEGHPPRPMRMRDGSGAQIPALAAADLAAAIDRALDWPGPYRPFTVTADVAGVSVVPDDTRAVLGWAPARVL